MNDNNPSFTSFKTYTGLRCGDHRTYMQEYDYINVKVRRKWWHIRKTLIRISQQDYYNHLIKET